jgi:Fic family protein
MVKDRSSEAHTPTLITDRKLIAEKEAENALRQFDHSMVELQKSMKSGKFNLKPSLILKLNRIALEDISPFAGSYRPAGVDISGSTHVPLDANEVPAALEEMCEYVNDQWDRKTAVHLAAFVLWRLNWIHPFVDGNGRTARVVSYLVMCAKLTTRLPGANTIPEQIAANKVPYYKALEAADGHFKVEKLFDVTELEAMLDAQLARQLVAVHEKATGNNLPKAGQTKEGPKPDLISSKGPRHKLIELVESHPVIVGAMVTILLAIVAAWLA